MVLGAYVIYCHTCIPTGKKYVGQTRLTMEHRWAQHLTSARARSTTHFHAAIRKYGPEAFSHEVLDEVEGQEAANAAEVEWIAKLDCRAEWVQSEGRRRGGPGARVYKTEDTRDIRVYDLRASSGDHASGD